MMTFFNLDERDREIDYAWVIKNNDHVVERERKSEGEERESEKVTAFPKTVLNRKEGRD